jgi:hypothetical protein
MATIFLPQGSILYFDKSTTSTPDWQKITEHNRGPFAIDTERFEKVQRMSNGTLRKIFIADKKTFNTSWSMLPSNSTMTVDGGWGAEDIRTFYHGDKGKKTFKIKIAYSAARSEEFVVSFTNCNFTINKRGVKAKTSDAAQEFWDVNIALEEV